MRTLVAVPVYNEQQYVTNVIAEIARYASCDASDVLVIDDGSTDATPTLLAHQPVDVIRHKQNLGYGRSIRDAFRWAQSYQYDWLITMDCDEQHEPRSLPDFHRAIARDDADIISGSRYLGEDQCGQPPPPDRRAINATVTAMVNERLNLSITDAFGGFKAYRVSELKHLELNENGYAMPLQVWVQAAANAMVVTEIPIRLIYRDANRTFGGQLDDPEHRLHHYQEVFDAELARFPDKFAAPCICSSRAPVSPGDLLG